MILEKIVRHKRKEVAALKKYSFKARALALGAKKRRFASALAGKKPVAVIAEIKRRSPSKGLLRKNFNAVSIAKAYEAGGASALSVLTDIKFFGGCAADLQEVRRAVKLPLLRKDFIIDEAQIYESRLLGADAILLIAAILSKQKMARFSRIAESLGLDVLFEVHTAAELKKVRGLKPRLLGVNNRNLKTFEVDLGTTAKFAKLAPKRSILISESGVKAHKDLLYLRGLGARAVLVGESLMRQKDVKKALRKLIRG